MSALRDADWEDAGTVVVTGRGFEQDAMAAMSTDIIRGLVEAITNADDKYRLEGAASGRIVIRVARRQGPWSVQISDRAGGMSKQELLERIARAGGRTSGFEAGAAVRGNRGRGAKDLAAFGSVLFESIKDGYFSALKLESNGDVHVTRKPEKAGNELRKRLGISHGGGTAVTINVRGSIRCPRFESIREKTQSHYQLRDIMRDPDREVLLINAGRPAQKCRLRYGVEIATLDQVLDIDLAIGAAAGATRIQLWRLPDGVQERPAGDAGRPQGIVIAGQHALYENTLFSFESNPYAHRFTGRLDCPHVDALIREYDERREQKLDPTPENPQPIVSRGRDGLVRDHPFYETLREAAEVAFSPILEEEEKKERSETGSVENESMRRALSRAAKTAARYLQRSLEELDEYEPVGFGEDAQFSIRPPRVHIREGEDKGLSVVAPADAFEEGDELKLSLDPEGVADLLEPSATLGPHRSRPDLLSATVHVRGLLPYEATILTAEARGQTTLGWVEVLPAEKEITEQPPESFAFEKDRYRVKWQKKKRLTLLAPLDPGLDGADVRVTSDDEGVAVLGGGTQLHIDPDRQALIGRVTVEGRTLDAKATLTATINGTSADCRVVVASQEDNDVVLEIRLLDQTLGSFRSTIKVETTDGRQQLFLDVMTRHPALKRYIGAPPDFEGQNSIHWRVLLAEIIAEATVRRILERKYPVDAEGIDAEAFFVELFQRTSELAPRIHRELVGAHELDTAEAEPAF